MHHVDTEERRRRLAVRHGMACGQHAADPAAAARRLVALHGTDPATVYLSLRARLAPSATPAEIEEALYERRELVRMLAMRRTVFVVPAESVHVVQRSVTDRIGRDQRERLLKLLAAGTTLAEPRSWLAEVEQSVLRALAEMGGTATASELAAAEPRLRTTIRLAAGKAYEAEQAITSRVLLVLSAQGHIVRGRPLGSWLSQQYRWVLTERWLGGGDTSRPAAPGDVQGNGSGPAPETADDAAARAELARQWLAAFGPAPLADLKWWTGWTMTQARQAAAAAGAIEVHSGSGPGLALAGDVAPTADPGPWAALLPALDPTVMGWSDRSWFLGPHGRLLFDTNGNAGPTVWLNGRIVGGWAQRADGEIAIRLLEDVGAEGTALIEAQRDAVGSWLAGVRVTPRFRTPVERELSA